MAARAEASAAPGDASAPGAGLYQGFTPALSRQGRDLEGFTPTTDRFGAPADLGRAAAAAEEMPRARRTVLALAVFCGAFFGEEMLGGTSAIGERCSALYWGALVMVLGLTAVVAAWTPSVPVSVGSTACSWPRP